MKKSFFLILFSIFFICLTAQSQSKIDSLKLEFKKKTDKIEQGEIARLLLAEHLLISRDTTQAYIEELLEIVGDDYRGQAELYRIIGEVFGDFGMLADRIAAFEQRLNIERKIGTKSGIARSLTSLGSTYANAGFNHEAIVYYLQAEEINKQLNDTIGFIINSMNMSFLYNNIEEYEKALEYRLQILDLARKTDSLIILRFGQQAFGQLYIEIGNTYLSLNNYDSSFEYYRKAEEVFTQYKNYSELGAVNNNYGVIYYKKGDYASALNYYMKALKLIESGDDLSSIALYNGNVGAANNMLGRYREGLKYSNIAYQIALDLNSHYLIRFAAENLTDSYESLGNFKEAFNTLQIYERYSDSLNISDSREKTLQAMQKTEFELEMKDLEIARKQRENEMNAEINQQKLLRNFALAGLALMIFGLYFAVRSYILKQRSNRMLTVQKMEIEEKNLILNKQKKKIEIIHSEVSQSIQYAERIQKAILPEEELVINNFADHFVLLIPKDRVSGDFYWWASVEDHLIIAAADCTGHGVPGAFMSMLGVSFLREIVVKEYITQPNVILRKLRKEIVKILKQEGKEGEQKDGMDIALICYNPKTKSLQYSGANNPLYILRQNEIEEIRPDKMPISIYDRMDKFTNHEIELRSGDSIYMFSDGYADQFGGERGKKFKYKPFKSLLVEISDKPMSEQRIILNNTFQNWKNKDEQTDDVLVLGFKV